MTTTPAAEDGNGETIPVARKADAHRTTTTTPVAGRFPQDASDGGVETDHGVGGYADDPGLPYERRPRSDDPLHRRDADSGST